MRSAEHHSPDVEATGPAVVEGAMRAVVRDAYGSVDVLRLGELHRPVVTDKQVLVRVRAAGLDRGAWHLMTGTPYALRLAFGLRRPKNPVLGRELAGVVEAVGAEVTRFSVGDEVYGIGEGSFAEYALAREDKLAPKPATLSFEQAAVTPISGLTALQALTSAGHVQAGQKVLVIGASGGVGSFAVQMAKALGAEVTGVSSKAKLELVRSLGADRVIDYAQEDWDDDEHHYDLILDIAGNPSPSRLRSALTSKGTAVLVGGEEGGSLTGGMGRQLRALGLSVFVGQKLKGMLCKERSSDLVRITELIESGQVTPSIGSTYPLDQVPEAMRRLEAGEVRGKVAITI